VELAGGKSEGMIELQQLRDEDGNLTVKVGDEIEAHVVETMGKSGCVSCAGPRSRADLKPRLNCSRRRNWDWPWKDGDRREQRGVEVLVAGVRGFCPISQLEMRHVEDASEYVGRKLEFRITRYDVDRRGDNLVVSRRALLEAEARARADKIRSKLVPGAVLPGVVVGLKDFGAFIDLGGSRHVACVRAGFSRGMRPADRLSLGQELEVQILRVEKTDDPKRPERISCRSSRWSEILGRTWPSSFRRELEFRPGHAHRSVRRVCRAGAGIEAWSISASCQAASPCATRGS